MHQTQAENQEAVAVHIRSSGELRVGRGTYCGTLCGRGCTRAEYESAVAGAQALLRSLPDGWEGHVWENLGWFYAAKRGVAALHPAHHPRKGRRFVVFLNTSPQVLQYGDDPRDLVQEALAERRRIEAETVEQLRYIEEGLL